MLRALLACRLGLGRATRIAGTIGQLFAVGFGVWGLIERDPMFMLVAFFIFLGAGSEASAVATRVAGRGLHVAEMMVTDFRTIPVTPPSRRPPTSCSPGNSGSSRWWTTWAAPRAF